MMSRGKELIRIWHENIELWKVHLEEISAQPKQENTQYLLDQVSRLTAENAMLKEKAFKQPELSTNGLELNEPVAWCQMIEGKVQDLLTSFEMKDWFYDKSWIPLYTTPPKREPLSDE